MTKLYLNCSMCGLLVIASACGFEPPALIPDVKPSFSNTGINGATEDRVVSDAITCAVRLNQHAKDAKRAYWIRTGFAILGALTAGAGGGGGGLAAVLSADADTQKVGGYIAIAGGIIGVLGTALSIGLADPSQKLDIHSRTNLYYIKAKTLAGELQDDANPRSADASAPAASRPAGIPTPAGVPAPAEPQNRSERIAKRKEMLADLGICINDGRLDTGIR